MTRQGKRNITHLTDDERRDNLYARMLAFFKSKDCTSDDCDCDDCIERDAIITEAGEIEISERLK
jgi:hypothetical protein